MAKHDLRISDAPENILVSQDTGLFNLHTALAGKSPETQRKYVDWIRHFYEEVIGAKVEDFENLPIEPFVNSVTPAAVEAWLGRYASAGHSKSGLGQARAAVVFLARMLVMAKQAPSSLWHDLKLVSLPDHAATAAYGESAGGHGARWLAPEEVRTLISAAREDGNTVRGERNAALILLMVTLGLRRDEVSGLEWDNLEKRGRNWVLRIRGKRNKWRAVDMPQDTILALQPWAELLTEGEKRMPKGIILRRVRKNGNIADAGITGNAVWRIITETWERTGMVGKLAPHDLRRTAAAIALEAGATEREIQFMLGHSSIETTHRYLAPMRENTATYRIAHILGNTEDRGIFG